MKSNTYRSWAIFFAREVLGFIFFMAGVLSERVEEATSKRSQQLAISNQREGDGLGWVMSMRA